MGAGSVMGGAESGGGGVCGERGWVTRGQGLDGRGWVGRGRGLDGKGCHGGGVCDGRTGSGAGGGRATWCLLLQQEGPHHQKAAGTPLGKTLPLGETRALGVLSAWVPLGTRLFGPQAWEGAWG